MNFNIPRCLICLEHLVRTNNWFMCSNIKFCKTREYSIYWGATTYLQESIYPIWMDFTAENRVYDEFTRTRREVSLYLEKLLGL